ncbi:MAG: hypothetical protein JWQ72_1278, partial [Polaromonas sp.]|nr:hypothetical protein [Polaromonas sp.]
HSSAQRPFLLSGAVQPGDKAAGPKLPNGRFAWPFTVARMREIAASQKYFPADLQAEHSSFVT